MAGHGLMTTPKMLRFSVLALVMVFYDVKINNFYPLATPSSPKHTTLHRLEIGRISSADKWLHPTYHPKYKSGQLDISLILSASSETYLSNIEENQTRRKHLRPDNLNDREMLRIICCYPERRSLPLPIATLNIFHNRFVMTLFWSLN